MLADKLFNLTSFQRQYDAILILSVSNTINDLTWSTPREELLSRIDWNNVIGIASALSYSDINDHLDAALRISQSAMSESTTTLTQKQAAAVILQSLTNRPAIKLAIERGYLSPDFENHLPLLFKLQNIKTEFEHSVNIGNNLISLNKFQSRVYNGHLENDAISISAPTSAGKSFILCNIIAEELLKGQINVVYIVPTRALIAQVEDDLISLFARFDLQNINLSTVPQYDAINAESNVFIFTQERLHWFMIEHSDLPLHMIIVDEAHKIEDSYRGILLQQKIEEVVIRNPAIKVYFSSPFTENPEILLDDLPPSKVSSPINTQFISVNQNLLFCTQVPMKSDQWELKLSFSDKQFRLGTIQLPDRPTTEMKKMAFISIAFSANEGGNIIYANGAAEAEEIALILFDSLEENQPILPKNKLLINLVKKTVHNDYRLAKVLERRIAFHYGNMPLIIRQEIEELFKTGEIKYLICTSTLLEGVNLPAKSIFIRKPIRGRNKPLSHNDFWNLAGRAGRWGKEFSGNIICIEPLKWPNPPTPEKKKQKIVRALDVVEQNIDELIQYIDEGTPRELAESRQDLEFAFGYFYGKFITQRLPKDRTITKQLSGLFDDIQKNIDLPNEIILRNPGISPIAQQNLLNYFKSKLNVIEELVPVYPEDTNAFDEYTKLVARIGKTISNYQYQLNSPRAILLINWMAGKPLSYIIRATYNSYQKKEKYATKKTIHVVLREVMDNVETFARFRFAKDSSCYIDILRYFLKEIRRDDLAEQIPQLNLWLEFGVSQKTHLSLLSLGLTRNTVVELTKYITDTNMNREESLLWIRKQNIDQLDLSPIIKNDILSKI